jgi:hypothetical protein
MYVDSGPSTHFRVSMESRSSSQIQGSEIRCPCNVYSMHLDLIQTVALAFKPQCTFDSFSAASLS